MFIDGQEKSKPQRQPSQDKNSDSVPRSNSNPNFSRSDSNSSNSNSATSTPSVSHSKNTVVSIPPVKGDVSVRTRCREMIATSLKTDERRGKIFFSSWLQPDQSHSDNAEACFLQICKHLFTCR